MYKGHDHRDTEQVREIYVEDLTRYNSDPEWKHHLALDVTTRGDGLKEQWLIRNESNHAFWPYVYNNERTFGLFH